MSDRPPAGSRDCQALTDELGRLSVRIARRLLEIERRLDVLADEIENARRTAGEARWRASRRDVGER